MNDDAESQIAVGAKDPIAKKKGLITSTIEKSQKDANDKPM